MRRTRAILLAAFLLAGCFGKKSTAPVVVEGAMQALVPVLLLQQANTVLPFQLRPASSMGVYAAGFLALRSLPSIGAALQGLEVQRLLLPPSEPSDDRVYAVLTELGAALEVNVPDYLNRSSDRATDLDAYSETLTRLLQDAEEQRRLVEEDIAKLKAQQKVEQTRVRDLDRTLRDAKKAANYALAGTTQEELATAEADLAKTKSTVNQRNDTVKLFEELLEIGGERLTAISQNREILIAGLRVIEVPGIEDLQILESGGSFRRSGASRTRSSNIL